MLRLREPRFVDRYGEAKLQETSYASYSEINESSACLYARAIGVVPLFCYEDKTCAPLSGAIDLRRSEAGASTSSNTIWTSSDVLPKLRRDIGPLSQYLTPINGLPVHPGPRAEMIVSATAAQFDVQHISLMHYFHIRKYCLDGKTWSWVDKQWRKYCDTN